MLSYRKSDGGSLAKVALELATTRPELVFRNPEKVEQGWRQIREDRAAFVAFFGGDELVLQSTCATRCGDRPPTGLVARQLAVGPLTCCFVAHVR